MLVMAPLVTVVTENFSGSCGGGSITVSPRHAVTIFTVDSKFRVGDVRWVAKREKLERGKTVDNKRK